MSEDVKIFAKTIEQEAKKQIDALAAHPVSDGSKIRIMPDVHAGAGCTIGTTMTITDRVCPNLVGVDIGCGMVAIRLGSKKIDFDELDKVIRWNVPAGFSVHSSPIAKFEQLEDIRCHSANITKANCSLGTLGGGNHFIEVDRDSRGSLWLVIHSGSRHLGLEVANWYQDVAWESISKPGSTEVENLIREYKAAGRQQEIAEGLKKLKKEYENVGPKDLAYLTEPHIHDYLHDMKIVQEYADFNRMNIARSILKGMKLMAVEEFSTVHNYIDLDSMILRKGAVSAKRGELLIIPMNMRDGSLICKGKGNADWNFSAPHGAGRLMSRSKAKADFTLGQYKESMKGIHSCCVNFDTIDEAPFAYKDMSEIVELIKPTCKVLDTIKPVYNFKASG